MKMKKPPFDFQVAITWLCIFIITFLLWSKLMEYILSCIK